MADFCIALTHNTQRIYPDSVPFRRSVIHLNSARNEQQSFQCVVWNRTAREGLVHAEALSLENWKVRVRRVGYVPVRHHSCGFSGREGSLPGYVPDPLFEEKEALVAAGEAQAFWITVRVPPDASVGIHELILAVKVEGREMTRLKAFFHVYPPVLNDRKGFRITQWIYADAIADWYRLPLWQPAFWNIWEKYIRNAAEHGQDTLYVPLITPALDGIKRPTQLLGVRGRRNYRFNWDHVAEYLRRARKCGIEYFEMPHLFTQWGAENAVRVYSGQGETEKLLWPPETQATDETYRNFLEQMLPELLRFADRLGIRKKLLFHLSDEPHGEKHMASYRAARELVKSIVPQVQIMDALSEVQFARQGLVDLPVASIDRVPEFEGLPVWCYYCCGPRGTFVNRLMDSPLAEIAMHGFLFYRWPLQGFLHWGFNYWYRRATRNLIDPFTVQDGEGWPEWSSGDTFVVYPGPDGPMDSVRWEVFSESLQDYVLLQNGAVPRESRKLSEIRSFQDFPREARWRNRMRKNLLQKMF